MTRNPNRMQEAVDKLMGNFATSASVEIVYSRGTDTTDTITATVGRTPFDLTAPASTRIAFERRDYILKAIELDFGSGPVTPASGDIITEASGRTYEVAADHPRAVFESIGPDSTVLKIHTKAMS
jgi:hypothetical protein